MADSGLYQTKDYEISALEIIFSSGRIVNINNLTVQFQLYQDIWYGSVMSGDILIDESLDLFTNETFYGNELIRLVIKKYGDPIEKIFRIYKAVRAPSERRTSAQSYVLYFCSEELFLSEATRISKAYKNKKVHEIVYDILTNYLKVSGKKTDKVELTSGTYDYIIPNYRPFEAIQWVISRAYNDEPRFSYFFYENLKGFSFASAQKLFKQEPKKKIRFDVSKTTNTNDIANNVDVVDKFDILNDFNVITTQSNGGFASKLLTVDLIKQKFKKETYSLSGKESILLNKNLPFNAVDGSAQTNLMKAYDSLYLTNVKYSQFTDQKDNNIEKWMMTRAMHLTMLNTFKLKLVIAGDINLSVGDIIHFDFPLMVAPTDAGKQFDPYRTCNYLVTSVNHKFRSDMFESVIEICTDSFGKALPSPAKLPSKEKLLGTS